MKAPHMSIPLPSHIYNLIIDPNININSQNKFIELDASNSDAEYLSKRLHDLES